MSTAAIRLRLLCTAAVPAVLMAACTGRPADLPGHAPDVTWERPRALDAASIEPCSVLDPQQRAKLAIHGPIPLRQTRPTLRSCLWQDAPLDATKSYTAGIDLDHDTRNDLNQLRGGTLIKIAGFPAVETQVSAGPTEGTCTVIVDNNSFTVIFDDERKPPMTRQQACTKAREAAELGMATLLARGSG